MQVLSHTAIKNVVQHQIAICTTIAYDKQYCTKLLIMICVLQNYTAMIASTFYIAQCSETIKMLYAQPLLMINNIAQLCLS